MNVHENIKQRRVEPLSLRKQKWRIEMAGNVCSTKARGRRDASDMQRENKSTLPSHFLMFAPSFCWVLLDSLIRFLPSSSRCFFYIHFTFPKDGTQTIDILIWPIFEAKMLLKKHSKSAHGTWRGGNFPPASSLFSFCFIFIYFPR